VKATWTYQVPPAGADATGLEDYVVETREGEAAGKVISSSDFTREFALFLVPALFLAAAGVLAYRTFREPYER